MADYPYHQIYSPPVPPLPGVLAGQQALFSSGWLPEGLFPEADMLRAEHLTVLAALEEAEEERDGLRLAFNEEDEAREQAVAEGEQAPTITGSAERKDRLDEAQARCNVAITKLAEFVGKAAATFTAHEKAWLDSLHAQKMTCEEEIRKAEEKVLDAKRQQGQIEKQRMWVARAVNPKGGRWTGFEDMPDPPEPKLDLATAFLKAESDGEPREMEIAR